MEPGIAVNGALTLFAGMCFVYVSTEVVRRRAGMPDSSAAVAFFALAGIHLLLAGVRQIVAFDALLDPTLTPFDAALFYVVNVPAAFTVIPVVHLALSLRGRKWWADAIAAALVPIALVGLSALFLGGVEGPIVSAWGSDWRILSPLARAMAIAFLALPAILASLALLSARAWLPTGAGRRASLIGAAALVYYLAITPDAFGLEGIAFLAARAALAVAAVLAYAAYFPHTPAVERPAGVF